MFHVALCVIELVTMLRHAQKLGDVESVMVGITMLETAQ